MTTTSSPTPVTPAENPTLPFWRTDLHELDEIRTTPELPETSDIVIIGGGYAGVSVAYHLVNSQPQNTPAPSITILEARQICSGATGRNGGHLRPDVYHATFQCMEQHGLEAATELAKFEVSHIPAVRDVIAKESIDCDFHLSRCMNVYFSDENAEKAKEIYDALHANSFPYADNLQYTPQTEAEKVSGVKYAKACISFPAGKLWAYKLVLGLLARIVKEDSVNVQTHTPVISVEADGADHFVHTPRGTIRTSKVVYTTNAYTAGLLPEYAASIVPCRGICCHIAIPETETAPYLEHSYALWNKEGKFDSYLTSRPDGSIIVGGASTTFAHAKEQWYNMTDDSTLIEPTKNYWDGYMQRTFNGWEKSEAAVKEIWTGIMGYSYEIHPHIGEVPDKPGQYVCAGFNGHGMPVVFLSGKGIAEMIHTGKKFEEVGLPRVYRTSAERLQAAQEGPEGGSILA